MYKVLIVDDEPLILEGLHALINWWEYDLEIIGQALNGLEALDLLQNNLIDILITDIKMPEMNGLELIRQAKKNYPQLMCIIISSYDEFEYTKEAVKLKIENYLLKPIDPDELISTLTTIILSIEQEFHQIIEQEKKMNIIKNNILCRWITGSISEEEFYDRVNFLSINIFREKYQTAIFKCINNDYFSENYNDSKIRVYELCKSFFSNKSTLVFLDLYGNTVVLLDNKTYENDLIIETALLKCIFIIQEKLCITVFGAVGEAVFECMSVHRSYNNALELLEYRIFNENKSLFFWHEHNALSTKSSSSVKLDVNLLRKAIITKDFDNASTHLEQIFLSLEKDYPIIPSLFYNIVLEIVFIITSTTKSVSNDTQELYSNLNNIRNTITSFNSVGEIKLWVKTILMKSIAFISNEYIQLNPIIKSIIEYTELNFQQDINIKVLASQFYVNADYLGRLFKSEVGLTYTNYLNKIRLEKAKYLLLNSHMKISDISKQVGYTNTNYFFTIFKKIIGTSPQDFRRI